MSNTSSDSSSSHSGGSRNPRVARRNNRTRRVDPYPRNLTLTDVASRLSQYERRLNTLDTDLRDNNESWGRETLERVTGLSADLMNTADAMDTFETRLGATVDALEIVQNQRMDDQAEISFLRSRLHQCETRLRDAEEAVRMAGQLAESVDRLTALLPQLNLRRD